MSGLRTEEVEGGGKGGREGEDRRTLDGGL